METSPILSDETDFAWSEETTPISESLIEELVQQTSPHLPVPSRVRRGPIVRRHHNQSPRESSFPSSFQRFDYKSSRMDDQNHSSGSSTSPNNFVFVASAQVPINSWSRTGFVEEEIDEMEITPDDGEDVENLLEPKMESPDSETLMGDLLDAGVINTVAKSISPSQAKRPRGRPRKHPVQTLEALAKVAKGRSKTGCITCRKRKKKCDEAKPRCLNCEKNAVLCEGYPERTVWKSGRERADEARFRRVSLPNIRLQPVIHGVDTPGDRIFFEHYVFRLSAVLTVEGPEKNAFKDMLLPMAVQHLGLMHSILALSSTNIDYTEPYGKELMAKYPDVTENMLQQRSQFHQDQALREFYTDIEKQKNGVVENVILSVRYGQMLCMVVQSLTEGKATGEHRIHLNGYQKLIRESPPEEGPFMEFIQEYFQFHISLDELISPPRPAETSSVSEDWNLPSNIIQPDAVRLLGVQDRLFVCMSKITGIRNKIRTNMENKLDPVVDYTSLYRATEIDAEIRDWSASWPKGDARDVAGLLYKQMMWVYLWRTIYPPKSKTWVPDPKITQAVNEGLLLLELVPPNDPSQTVLLAPTFIIGCAAFDPDQRIPVRKSITTIKNYTHLKNADLALEVLKAVWKYMDAQDERSWDWQTIAQSMGMDFLAT